MADDVQRLVALAQGGDSGAFAELYEQFAPVIQRFLLRHVNGDRELAEDLTGDVFVKVVQRLGSYRDCGAPFSAWLYRVARNHLIDYQRSRPRPAMDSLDEAAAIPEPSAEAALDRSLDRQELVSALDALTPDQRHVVTLRWVLGYTLAETAMAMGKTEDAVKKLQARGLHQLRRVITRAGRGDTTPRRRLPASAAPGSILVRLGVA